MNKRTVPLLLVAYSARSLLASAHRAGVQIEMIDFFADADAQGMAPVHKVASWAQVPAIASRLQPQAILVGSGFETQPEMVAALREIAPLLNTSAASCEACRDPAVWPAIIRRSGCDSPAVIVTGIAAANIEAPADWLLKNRWTAGGGGVRELELAAKRGRLLGQVRRGDYLQQRLHGTPCSALFWLGTDRRCCLGFFRQLSGESAFGAKSYAYAGAIGPLPIEGQRESWLNQLSGCLANEFGLSGIVGVDLIDSGRGLAVIEINPRITATAELWERANPEISLVDRHLKGTLNSWNERLQLERTAVLLQGKAILYRSEPAPLVIGPLEFDVLCDWWRRGKLADLPSLNSSIPPGTPIATLFAEGPSEDEVLAELKRRAGELRQALAAAATR